jgi:hypothetical protein
MHNETTDSPFARIWAAMKNLIAPPRVKFVRR